MDNNKIKLLWGIFFIGAAFLFIIAAFYFFGPANQFDKKEPASVNDQTAKSSEQPSPAVSGASSEPMKLEGPVKKSEVVYDSAEKARKEGSLWLDRRSNNFIVTLGTLHGLRRGSELSIYDGGHKIDTASVETPFDIISYVKPVKHSPDSFTGSYYRVVIEDSPHSPSE